MSSPPGAVRRVLAGTVRVDRAQLRVQEGAVSAVGVAVPLALGLLADRPLDGAAAASGALFAGFAAFAGGYRTRAAAVATAAVVTALSTFVGAVVGPQDPWLVLAAAVWGLGAGLVVSLGLAASIVGVQAVLGLLVFSQYEMPVDHAAGRSLLVLAGGLGQLLLVVTAWPLRRHPAERRALAAVYRGLGAYAAAVPAAEPGGPPPVPPPAGPLQLARTALGDPQPFARGDAVLVFRGLLDEAERVRTGLSALASARQHLAGVPRRAAAVTALDELVTGVADVLREVAAAAELPSTRARVEALRAAGPEGSPERWAALTAAAERLEQEARAAGPAVGHAGSSLVVEVARRTAALLGQLRTVVRVAAGPSTPAARVRQGRRGLPGRDALTTLRANLTPASAAFRHAVRLSAALAVGTAGAFLLPFEHRYWLPLTAAVVLKPDFTSTFTRGIGRILGTLAGAGVATGLVVALRPPPAVLVLLVLVLAAAAYTVLFANYALYGAAITGLVVALLAVTELPTAGTALDRVEATVLGGLLALLAYLAWPTWEAARVPEQLARLVEAQERYGGALLAQYARPGPPDLPPLRDLRAAARLARSNAEASVDRMVAEPGLRSAGLPDDVALGVLAATRRYALAALSLHAHLPQAAPEAAPRQLAELSAALSAGQRELAAALRAQRPAAALPPLRAGHRDLVSALRAEAEDPVRSVDAAVLDVETDLMVDSLGTAADLLAGAGPRPPRGRKRTRDQKVT